MVALQETNVILSPSDVPQDEQEPHLRLDVSPPRPPVPSTSGVSPQASQLQLLEPPRQRQLEKRRHSAGLSGRCPDCGKKREDAISYTIEDLDAVGSAPLESSFANLVCTCDQITPTALPNIADGSSKPHPDLRKYRSVDTSYSRWSGSFLSPDDAIWDVKNQSDDTTDEYRWALDTSRSDVNYTRRVKCSCHDLTPEEKRHPERSDLRKHHSAETDKWSLRPDHLGGTPLDLRKHLSDASGMATGVTPASRTLQVPEVMPNPKPRCTCPKTKTLIASPSVDEKLLTIETTEQVKPISENEDIPRAPMIKRERGRLVQQKAIVGSSKKWEPKVERSKWAGRVHLSLQTQKKEIKYNDAKSKSLKDRQRYSVRRSLSPEPDSMQVVRVNSRIIKRLISPKITITDAKWAPYEGYSPLPCVGIKKREPKRISDIKWTPYDGSASELSILEVPEETDDYHITPTCHPPSPPRAPSPAANEQDDDEERERWRFLNQISPFPIYQGAWRDESPPLTPPKIVTPEDLEPPIWKLLEQPVSPINISLPSPVQEPIKSWKESKKKKNRSRSKEENKLIIPTVIIRAASQEPTGRQRPLLTRSKALLEIPRKGIDLTKRSLSEEVPRFRSKEAHRGPSRAKSEESSRHPWDESEVRQYVTTV